MMLATYASKRCCAGCSAKSTPCAARAKRPPAHLHGEFAREREAEQNASDAANRRPHRTQAAGAKSLPQRTGTFERSGTALPESVRRLFEPRLGYDLSRVRVHAEPADERATRALGAEAFSVGERIFFAQGAYAPASERGQRLLAHELTHIAQSAQGAPLRVRPRLRVETPNAALPGSPPREQWEDIRDYVNALSGSTFDVKSNGEINPVGTVCSGPSRTSNQCLCELHAAPSDWTIVLDDVEWPHTDEMAKRVSVHSTRSTIAFGAWGGGAQRGTRIEQGSARVLGHELCGHAWLMEKGTHPSVPLVTVGGRLMGRPGHDATVAIENTVAGEISAGAPQRGLFSDPHHGESFARVTVTGYPSNASAVSALPVVEQRRLVRARDAMMSDRAMRADVIGHSDSVGSPASMQAASLARARGVVNHLVSLGVPRGRFLEVQGVGDRECVASPAGPAACRKADVFMFMFQGASLRNP
jgi:hypothetical protein